MFNTCFFLMNESIKWLFDGSTLGEDRYLSPQFVFVKLVLNWLYFNTYPLSLRPFLRNRQQDKNQTSFT